MAKIISTERTSDKYLLLNACGVQNFYERDGVCDRPVGRVDYQLLYVAEGACLVYTDDSVIRVERGGIVLYRPRVPQRYRLLAEERTTSFYIHFTGRGCEEIFGDLGLSDAFVLNIGKNHGYERVFERLLDEYSTMRPRFEAFAAAYLQELFAIISRSSLYGERNFDSESRRRVDNACRTVAERLGSITVAELAEEAHLSVGRFSAVFRELMGRSAGDYITALRIERAKELLCLGTLSVREVGEAVGYSDQNYFSRAFKKRVGASPSLYRRYPII